MIERVRTSSILIKGKTDKGRHVGMRSNWLHAAAADHALAEWNSLSPDEQRSLVHGEQVTPKCTQLKKQP